ncbi:hypothetical protein BCR33DRAFT_848070 [Rhizoclosmatium globosum]|uniref:Uncharacterized protein n=1 Tax=Rhizoclosmatium globosum TaxID=329046 RepID=A0A1Y2CP22_9FUNG|nr:hypothetical protein BCR33DRAFT_848070 [Rhizoclosmatium globosum]|eukprot:ORY48717.1 hypothetical protein BCR33DRAFT_848070 [Rhizoclosmatium globosum]
MRSSTTQPYGHGHGHGYGSSTEEGGRYYGSNNSNSNGERRGFSSTTLPYTSTAASTLTPTSTSISTSTSTRPGSAQSSYAQSYSHSHSHSHSTFNSPYAQNQTLQNTQLNSSSFGRLSLPSSATVSNQPLRSRFASSDPRSYAQPPSSSYASDYEQDDSYRASVTPSAAAQSLSRGPYTRPSTAGHIPPGARSSIIPPASLSMPSYAGPAPRYNAWDSRDVAAPSPMGSVGSLVNPYRPSSAAASYTSNSSSSRLYTSERNGEDPFFDRNQRRKDSTVDYGSDYDSSASVTSASRNYRGQRRVEFEDDRESLRSDRATPDYSATTPRQSTYSQLSFQKPSSSLSYQSSTIPPSKPTLTPNYPTRPSSSQGLSSDPHYSTRPGSATGHVSEQSYSSPRLRANSVGGPLSPTSSQAPPVVEHSTLPKSLGSHSRYIQSLLEKTATTKPAASSPLANSTSNSPTASPNPPSTTPQQQSQQPQQQTFTTKQYSQPQPQPSTSKSDQKPQQPQPSPTTTQQPQPTPNQQQPHHHQTEPSKPLRRLKNQSLSGSSLREAASSPESGAALAELQRAAAAASASASSTVSMANGNASSDSLVGEIEGMKSQIGLLNLRFGGGSGGGGSGGGGGGGAATPVLAVGKVGAGGATAGVKDRQAFETAITYISRTVRQSYASAVEINKLISSGGAGGAANGAILLNMVENHVAQLKGLDGMVELMKVNERIVSKE